MSAELFTEIDTDNTAAFAGMPNRWNSEWTAKATVEHADVASLDGFLKRHYLGKRPGVCVCSLRLRVKGVPCGAIVFALPPPETETRYRCTVWELARLYLLQDLPRNSETWFIAKAIEHVKQCHREVGCLVSYADPEAGHAGTIYKASNWIYDGMTGDGRSTPRCDYIGSDGKKYARRSHIPNSISFTREPRSSKHRFMYPIRALKLTLPES